MNTIRPSISTMDYLQNIVRSGHTGIIPFKSGRRRSVTAAEASYMIRLYEAVEPRTRHVLALSMRRNVCLFNKILAFAQKKLH